MSNKRRATTQLNHDNWDDEPEEVEEIEEPIVNVPLENRVIKKAKRVLSGRSSDGSSPGFPSDGASPASSSPFTGFSGFSKNTARPFSWNKPDSAPKVFGKLQKQNGSGNTEGEVKVVDRSSPTKTNVKRFCVSEEAKSESKDLEHFQQLQKLNESVLKWMQVHMAKNPYCDFTPVFNDYKNHLVKLEQVYPLKKQAAFPSVSKGNDNSTSFKMPPLIAGKSSGFLADSSADSIMKSGFSKFMKSVNDSVKEEKSDSDDSEMKYGAGFNSNTTNTSTVSQRFKCALTATSTGSPMGPTSSHSAQKKSESDEDKKDDSPFSFKFKSAFGSTNPFAKGKDGKADSEPFRFAAATVPDTKPFSFGVCPPPKSTTEQGEEEYIPPQNEVDAVVEEDATYSIKCKLFFKKDGAFVDKGVGTLYLKPVDEKTQLLVRANTKLGNILLNIMLSSALPIQRTGKNNVLIVCVPNPPIDTKKPDSEEAIPMLIRVKTDKDADELLEALNSHKS